MGNKKSSPTISKISPMVVCGIKGGGKTELVSRFHKLAQDLRKEAGKKTKKAPQTQKKKGKSIKDFCIDTIVDHKEENVKTKVILRDYPGNKDQRKDVFDFEYKQEDTVGVIYVVGADFTDDQLTESKEYFEWFMTQEHMAGIPLLFIVNKQDTSSRSRDLEFMIQAHGFPVLNNEDPASLYADQFKRKWKTMGACAVVDQYDDESNIWEGLSWLIKVTNK